MSRTFKFENVTCSSVAGAGTGAVTGALGWLVTVGAAGGGAAGGGTVTGSVAPGEPAAGFSALDAAGGLVPVVWPVWPAGTGEDVRPDVCALVGGVTGAGGGVAGAATGGVAGGGGVELVLGCGSLVALWMSAGGTAGCVAVSAGGGAVPPGAGRNNTMPTTTARITTVAASTAMVRFVCLAAAGAGAGGAVLPPIGVEPATTVGAVDIGVG
jgi:hypothetical protein